MAEGTVNNKTVEQSKHLLSITTDGMDGYKQAADNSPGPEFTALFTAYLIQRGEHADELKKAIKKLGGDSETVSGGTFSALGRLWTTIKTTISSDAERTALEACTADEKAAIAEYDKVLADPGLSADIKELLTDQKAGIERALTRSEQLGRVYN